MIDAATRRTVFAFATAALTDIPKSERKRGSNAGAMDVSFPMIQMLTRSRAMLVSATEKDCLYIHPSGRCRVRRAVRFGDRDYVH